MSQLHLSDEVHFRFDRQILSHIFSLNTRFPLEERYSSQIELD